MLYSSSKDALRRALVGVGIEVQATDFSEISHETSKPYLATIMHVLTDLHSPGQGEALWLLIYALLQPPVMPPRLSLRSPVTPDDLNNIR